MSGRHEFVVFILERASNTATDWKIIIISRAPFVTKESLIFVTNSQLMAFHLDLYDWFAMHAPSEKWGRFSYNYVLVGQSLNCMELIIVYKQPQSVLRHYSCAQVLLVDRAHGKLFNFILLCTY